MAKLKTGTKSKVFEIKKLKSGKLVFTLDFSSNEDILYMLMGFLETESVNLLSVKLDRVENLHRHVMYSILYELYAKPSWMTRKREIRHRLNRSEALALVWFFRDMKFNVDHPAQLLKGALHQALL